MLINLRNALMTGKRLPYDAEVEYLESTGTQYIDTGVKKTSGITIDCTFSLSATSSKAIFGARTSASALDRFMLMAIGTYFRFDARYQPRLGTPDTTSMFRFQYDGENATITNLTTGTTSTSSTPVGDAGVLDISLFGVNTNGVVVSLMLGRMYACKIWKSGFLVRDYIPVRKKTVGYLYDRVSGKLFGNAGTGDFVRGPDVVPVEYIESHGTEYINTGVIATNSHGFRVDVATAQKSGNTNARIFGVHEGNVRCGFALYGTGESSGNDFFWGWNAASGFTADIPQRFVASLNYKNDRAAIFNGTTNLSSLGTLGNTTKSIYLLNANYNGAPFEGQYVIGRLYKAEISIGSDISNNFLPVRVGTGSTWEGAMMDVLTRRIYRNAGTGAFTYGNDLKYPIPAA